MKRTYKTVEDAEKVVNNFFWLAWLASGEPFGMGRLQAKPNATKEDVINNILNAGDYPWNNNDANSPYADYVFGKMMKVGLQINDCTIEVDESPAQSDYQSWANTYKNAAELLEAAENAAGIEQSDPVCVCGKTSEGICPRCGQSMN